jgi:hypothetical protein
VIDLTENENIDVFFGDESGFEEDPRPAPVGYHGVRPFSK